MKDAGKNGRNGKIDGHGRLLIVIVFFIESAEETVADGCQKAAEHAPEIDFRETAEISFCGDDSGSGEGEKRCGEIRQE